MTGALSEVDQYLLGLEQSWPPETLEVRDGWRLRAAPGAGRRVNSAMRPGGPTAITSAEFDLIEGFYTQRGAAPTIQFGASETSTDLDEQMAARGYAMDVEALLYDAPLASIDASTAKEVRVLQVRTPLAELDRVWARGGVSAARRAVMERGDPATSSIFIARLGAKLSGALFASVAEERVYAHALYVSEDARRSGVANTLLGACATFGAKCGADRFGAPVETQNAPSRALFEKIGCAAIGAYRYYVKSSPL